MTSGDGERLPPPGVPATSSTIGVASPATELCYDSDDLLTPRRGGMPMARVNAGNGHTVVPDAADGLPSGVDHGTAVGDATPLAAGPADQTATDATPEAPSAVSTAAPYDPTEDTSRSEPASVLSNAANAASAAGRSSAIAVLAPPQTVEHTDVESEPPVTVESAAAAEEEPLATGEATASSDLPVLTTRADEPPAAMVPRVEIADDGAAETAATQADVPVSSSGDAPDGRADNSSEAPVADGIPDADAPDAVPVAGVPDTAGLDATAPNDITVADAEAPTNGVAVHTAGTAEYPIPEAMAPSEPISVPIPEDNHAEWRGEVPIANGAAEGPDHTDSSVAVMDPPIVRETNGTTEAAHAIAIDAPAMPGIGFDQFTATVTEPVTLPTTELLAEPIVATDPDIPAIPPAEPPAPPLAATPPPPPAAPPPEEEEEGATMTIIEHLEELRHRITISAISVVVGAVIAWFIVPYVVHYLETAFQKLGGKFFSQTILGPFGLELKLSFLIGLIIASPVVLFQIWGFVAPGLTRREKRYALPFSFIGSGLFAAGAATGILIVPLAIQFLTHFFTVLDLEQLVDIDKYIMFIALIAVIFGITFELPIFMVGFSLLGIVNSRFFIQKFRIAVFIIFGVSMVITPGADLISPLVLGGFLTILYWLGVFLIRVIGR